jgi:hypothetical protein
MAHLSWVEELLYSLEHQTSVPFFVLAVLFVLALDHLGLKQKCNQEQLEIILRPNQNQFVVFVFILYLFEFHHRYCYPFVHFRDHYFIYEFQLPYLLELQYLLHQ